ncbi:MAG: succinate dehydrogenase [Paenibacillaceae bacterium]|jgi:succinate dehydrogenase / fumarate reductase cytochrome b subunit|nr:succinate dehydrogenase [Paenibacillaceae bacterium]
MGNSYVYRKVHSLLGVVPLGGFLMLHMVTNYAAFQGGADMFREKVQAIHELPLLLALEVLFIWLPLLYHGGYGLYVAMLSRAHVTRYTYGRNVMFALQRVTGVVAFVFLVWHVWTTRGQVGLGTVEVDGLGAHMHDIATNALYYWLYIIGIVASVFHFANGLWSFFVSWGITVGARAQRVSTVVTMVLFVVCSSMFILALNAFLDSSFAEASADVFR